MVRLGSDGIAACHPLHAFHLLNNFTLCHGAIDIGATGPASAFFSRGGGTVIALMEAIHAVADGDCERALAGGADSALHPVTWAELARCGLAERGLVPGEGAALLAIAPAGHTAALAHVVDVRLYRLDAGPWPQAEALCALPFAAQVHAGPEADVVVIAAWCPAVEEQLAALAAAIHPGAAVLRVNRVLGETLAASAALAWIVAVDCLQGGAHRTARVLSAGPDGDLGDVLLRAEAP
jgi:3-oxoacyl-[acyl-carrier-protein] synthase II